MKLVVITGCLGFIGSHITRLCLENRWKVLGIDKCTYAANEGLLTEFNAHKNFTFLKEDICNLKFLPDCDYVINTAAETHVGNSIIDSSDFVRSNIDGVKNLLELIRHKPENVSQKPILFHISTDEVYGDIAFNKHMETDLLNPSNPYSASKAAADLLITAWSRTYGVDYIILRPTNNYGIGQYPEKFIPLSVKALLRNKKIRLHDAGMPVRNWLHAKDTALGVAKIINAGVINEVYNISGGFEQQNIDTVKQIINCYYNNDGDKEYEQWKELLNLDYMRPGQDVRYALDDSKLKNLGWSPKYQFSEEINTIVQFYKNNFRW